MEQIKNQRERGREKQREDLKMIYWKYFLYYVFPFFRKSLVGCFFGGVGVAEVEMTRNEREIFSLTENESIRVNERTLLKFFSAKKTKGK